MDGFGGNLKDFWRLDALPPINRLSWWWWWVLVLVPDPVHPERSRQLRVLRSSK